MVRSPNAVRSVTARSERPISRWISCARPPVCARARRALAGRARQHAVLGGHPALALAAQPAAARGPRPSRCTARACGPSRPAPSPRRAASTPRSILSGRSWRAARGRRGACTARRPRARPRARGSALGLRVTTGTSAAGPETAVRALEPRQVGLVDDRDGRQRAAEERLGDAREVARLVAEEEAVLGAARPASWPRSAQQRRRRRAPPRRRSRSASPPGPSARRAAARSAGSACSRGSGSRGAPLRSSRRYSSATSARDRVVEPALLDQRHEQRAGARDHRARRARAARSRAA